LIQPGVQRVVHAILKGLVCIINIELGIRRRGIGWRQKGSNPMCQLSMKLEDPWATTIIQAIIKLPSYRGHCQSIVVIVNVFTKCPSSWIWIREEIIELWRNWVKQGEGDLATIAACAKFGIALRRTGKTLILPMKCFTGWALYVKAFEVMYRPIGVKRVACYRKRGWWWQ